MKNANITPFMMIRRASLIGLLAVSLVGCFEFDIVGSTSSPPAAVCEATLTWNANTEPDLAGYKVHYGTSSSIYDTTINVGKSLSYCASGLMSGQRYYFVVTAYDYSGNDSGYSTEVFKDVL